MTTNIVNVSLDLVQFWFVVRAWRAHRADRDVEATFWLLFGYIVTELMSHVAWAAIGS